jgi:G:T-mismatch repair DNA endonuclease (very short patch repair protein)
MREMWKNSAYRNNMVIKHKGKVNPHRGKSLCEIVGEQRAEKIIKKWLSSCNKKPNKAEQLMFEILQKNFHGEFSMNVRGEVMILGGKVPDFVNVNGKKKIIELFGDFWHRGENPRNRINFFKRYGWSTLVVWEHELKSPKVLIGKIKRFVHAV